MEFAPVPAREHAIVWEIRPGEARGALIDFGAEQRIVLKRTWSAGRGAPLPSFLKLKQYRKAPVIVSLHPALARTFVLPFRLSGKKNDPVIAPASFQSMLQGFLEKTTFEMRRMAGEALGVEELDAILLDARLMKLVVDGEEAREGQPIHGRHVEGFLQVIFTTRAVFHDLHNLLHSRRELFFTERGPAAMSFLARAGERPAALLDLEEGGGYFFRMDHDVDEVLRKVPLKWDLADLPAAVAEHWHLSKAAAERMYKGYLANGFSAAVERTMDKLFAPLEEEFAKAVERATGRAKLGRRLYVRSTLPLPFTSSAPRAGAELAGFPLRELLEHSGVDFDDGGAADASFFLLPFLEYYYHRGDPAAHRALTRQIHWIAA